MIGAECSHLALMVDRNYVIRHISYSQEACLVQKRKQLLGSKCHKALWNLEQPCSGCPLSKEVPLDTSSIVSHFQKGTTTQIEGIVSESLMPLSSHQDMVFIVLVEPILPLSAERASTGGEEGVIGRPASELGLPSDNKEAAENEMPEPTALKDALNINGFDDFGVGSIDRTYLLHLNYHRMLYSHFSKYGLTHTEQEVALFILKGLSSKQVADRLFISKKTADFHRHNIRKKLGLVGKRVSIWNFLQSLLETDSK